MLGGGCGKAGELRRAEIKCNNQMYLQQFSLQHLERESGKHLSGNAASQTLKAQPLFPFSFFPSVYPVNWGWETSPMELIVFPLFLWLSLPCHLNKLLEWFGYFLLVFRPTCWFKFMNVWHKEKSRPTFFSGYLFFFDSFALLYLSGWRTGGFPLNVHVFGQTLDTSTWCWTHPPLTGPHPLPLSFPLVGF